MRTASWPGNARELRNAVERAALLAESDSVEPADLPAGLVAAAPVTSAIEPPQAAAAAPGSAAPTSADLRHHRAAQEREHIVRVLAETGGNQTKASERLGIARRTLSTKLDRLGIPRPRKR